MTASDHLSPQQFPHYERDWANLDKGDLSPTEDFGLPREGERPKTWSYQMSRGNPPEREIPVDQIVSRQPTVVGSHVRNLSTIPGGQFDPIAVDAFPDGRYAIQDGTHRSAAARVRGDKTIRARIEGTYSEY